MSHHEHVKIIAFVGLTGSGKSTAVKHFTDHGIPKIIATSRDELASEIDDLRAAGQHTVILDGLDSLDTLTWLKHRHPGAVHVVALVSPHRYRIRRTPQLNGTELDQTDWRHVETGTLGAVIALADDYVVNDGSLADLSNRLDTLKLL